MWENDGVDELMQRQREEVSKGVFGSAHMLAILVEISRSHDGRFTAPAVISGTQLPPSTVHAMLNRLKRISYVRRTDELTSDRLVVYQRLPHPIWEFARFVDRQVDEIGEHRLEEIWLRVDQPA